MLAALLLGPAPALAQQIDTMALRAHTRFLSSDRLEGRGTGSPGEKLAAQYIETQLKQLAVAPVQGTYQLPVPLRLLTIDSARIELRDPRDSTVFASTDFIVNTGGERALQNFQGAALFAGTVEHAQHLAASALSGRVLVLLGTLGTDARTLIPAWLRAGVAGVILLVPDSSQFELFDRSRGEERYVIAAPVDEPVWQSALPVLLGGPALTRALLAEHGAAVARLSRSGTFSPIPLQRNVRVSIHTTAGAVQAHNIIGVIPGSDPHLRNQVVLYTAHYDHLGKSTPDARGDSIYNGFSDNAAGVAMLLAIAQELKKSPPARSVAFLFLTGEERGLLGSTYYVTNPAIPLDSTVAVINLDAGAPSAPPVDWRIAGGARNPLGTLAQEVAQANGWQAELGEASPNSDYWPFHSRGVPAVFIIPGNRWEGLTSAQRDALRARWDRYHRADDEYAEDFPFSGMARYARYALLLGLRAAQR